MVVKRIKKSSYIFVWFLVVGTIIIMLVFQLNSFKSASSFSDILYTSKTSGRVVQETDTIGQVKIGEVGTTFIDNNWKIINFGREYKDPIVIARPLSYKASDPSHVRIKDVTSTGFKIKLEEWVYLDDTHVGEEVNYIVLNSGNYRLLDGKSLEVGKVWGNNNWNKLTFAQKFTTKPPIFAQSQTYNDANPIITRVKDASATGFSIKLQEEEAADGMHLGEVIGYVAIEQGIGEINGMKYEAGTFSISAHSTDVTFSKISFVQPYTSKPRFIAGVQTFNGGDPIELRYRNFATATASQKATIEVYLEEEKSKDDEIGHTAETVGYLAFDVGSSLKDIFVSNAYIRPVRMELDQDGITIATEGVPGVVNNYKYKEPIIIAGPPTYRAVDPVHVRITRIFDPYSLSPKIYPEIKLEEWNYEDGLHSTERADRILIDSGTYIFSNGKMVEVGIVQANHNWVSVTFKKPFAKDKKIINLGKGQTIKYGDKFVKVSKVGTFDGVITIEILNLVGFKISEASMPFGKAFLASGILIENIGINSGIAKLVLGTPITPLILAQSQTYNAVDPIVTRVKDVSATGFSVRVQEEEKLDGLHTVEEVGYVALEVGRGFINAHRRTTHEELSASPTPSPVYYIADRFSISSASDKVIFKDIDFSDAPDLISPVDDVFNPTLIAGISTYNGIDPVELRHRRYANGMKLGFYLEEETSKDTEIGHSSESISYFLLPHEDIIILTPT